MIVVSHIYDISSTILPLSRDVLDQCLNKIPSCGYVLCQYEDLITTINKITRATEIDATLNAKNLFHLIDDPDTQMSVVIKVEGIKKNHDQFINHIMQKNDAAEWTDFSTYSELMRDDIMDLKTATFKKYLWNYENIKSWFLGNNVKLHTNMISIYAADWDLFKKDVILTSDLDSFISTCDEQDLERYKNVIINNARKVLMKHKVEVMQHVNQSDHDEDHVTFVKPVISKIYVLSYYHAKCKKDWPTLPVISLSKRNFDMLALVI